MVKGKVWKIRIFQARERKLMKENNGQVLRTFLETV